MSVRVMALCYEVRFLSACRKAVAVAIADHVDDRGEHAFPSIARLAEKTEFSDRSVQYALRDLEDIGLLIVTDQGGRGATDTKEWRFDMTLLRNLAERNCEIIPREDAEDAPLEGATGAPKGRVRVQPVHGRVQLTTDKGAVVAPEPSLTSINHPGASARTSEGARAAPAPQQDRERLILETDAEWVKWELFCRQEFGDRFADDMQKDGRLIVYGPRPSRIGKRPDGVVKGTALYDRLFAERESWLPKGCKPKVLSAKSRAMSGEAA